MALVDLRRALFDRWPKNRNGTIPTFLDVFQNIFSNKVQKSF